MKDLQPSLAEIVVGPNQSKKYDLLREGFRYPPKVVIAKALQIEYGRQNTTYGFAGGENDANAVLRDLGYTIEPKPTKQGQLALSLHERIGRKEAYGYFGIHYDSRQQHLNLGLSPQLPDNGYFIFITLDKEGFDPHHDYADELFADKFIWVTRRDVSEDDRHYVNLRQKDCRVSLFVRHDSREQFLYAGELAYENHSSFDDPATGRSQMKFAWTLKEPLADDLLQQLTFGLNQRPKVPKKLSASSTQQPQPNTRQPSTFNEFKKAYSYSLGTSSDRTVFPEHHNFQVKLKAFLLEHKIDSDMERDFIDVSFKLKESYIGEIKITRNLTIPQAFRTAFGQLVEYKHLSCTNDPRMIMFLDQELDQPRLAIASKYAIAVVVLRNDKFVLMNPEICPAELSSLFSRDTAAAGAP